MVQPLPREYALQQLHLALGKSPVGEVAIPDRAQCIIALPLDPQQLPCTDVVILIIVIGIFCDQDRGTAVIVPDVPEDKGVDHAGRASVNVLAVHDSVRLIFCAALIHAVCSNGCNLRWLV